MFFILFFLVSQVLWNGVIFVKFCSFLPNSYRTKKGQFLPFLLCSVGCRWLEQLFREHIHSFGGIASLLCHIFGDGA